MSLPLLQLFVWAVNAYLLLGFLFAVPFVLAGVAKIDSHAAKGTWGFRILILPGSTLLWPMLARRWYQATGSPPDEHNAHRLAAIASSNP